MKIVSWNVNSIRARAERAEAWVRKHEPDVLALQETKVVDEDFPREAFKALGYHVETFGQKTYNGVAILSRTKPEDVVRGLPDDDEDAERRLLAATVDGVRIVNVYVPNGREVDTPPFEYKLAWLGRLRAFLDATATPAAPLIVLGDFNESLDGAGLTYLEEQGFRNVLPLFRPGQETWRYQAALYGQTVDTIDHILYDPSTLAPLNAWVRYDGNSDHLPVTAVFELTTAPGR